MKTFSRRALVFGVSGQDGALLAQHLLTQGYEVHGTSRQVASPANLQRLEIAAQVVIHTLDPKNRAQVKDAVASVRPSEIYNLSGQSSVGLSFKQPRETFESHVGSTEAILEAMRSHDLECRFFNASSGEIFGETGEAGADESSAIAPRSPYGEAKAEATRIVTSYRDTFGLFACSGLLFNHESVLRNENFVAQRVARGAAAIKLRQADRLTLGNLDIARDWGWASDYVACMARMLQQDHPRDYVVATGVVTSLESFVARVFGRFDLDWKDHVEREEKLVRPADIHVNVGNPRAAAEQLGWRATVRMPEVADRLADSALARSRPSGLLR